MSDADSDPPAAEEEAGVLGRLPKTRPQRPSARRATARAAGEKRAAQAQRSTGREQPDPAARAAGDARKRRVSGQGASKQVANEQATGKQAAKESARAQSAGKRQAQRPSQAQRSSRAQRPSPTQASKAPIQGFESDGDLAAGASVQPPSSSEIAASVVELFGELAQSGLSGGGRLVKDALTRLLSS